MHTALIFLLLLQSNTLANVLDTPAVSLLILLSSSVINYTSTLVLNVLFNYGPQRDFMATWAILYTIIQLK